MKLLSVLVLILWGFLVSSCAVVKYFVCSDSSSSAGSCCCCSESRWECFLVWVRLLCSSTIFKKCKNRCTAFPLFSKWAAILKLLFWLAMSEQTKEGMLLKLLNCRVDVLWNGPHGRSWRGVGRAWYQSSVVLLFHARLESTSLWTRLREWRHCRAETRKEIPQTFGTKLKAKYRFDWTSCAKMTGWYLQFNHSGVFYLQASFVRAPFSFSLCSFV